MAVTLYDWTRATFSEEKKTGISLKNQINCMLV